MSNILPIQPIAVVDTPPRTRARVTVVESVYYQMPGKAAVGPETARYTEMIDTEEFAYSRTVKIYDTWVRLDLGWLEGKRCYMLKLQNTTHRPPSTTPSPEELREHESRVLEYGICPVGTYDVIPIGFIKPGQDARWCPINPERIYVRCKTDKAELSYFVIPGEGK